MKISTILDQIDFGSIALPKFQRGYVWNRDQVRNLMRSLYLKHPIGSLLFWETRSEGAQARGDSALPLGSVKLLLDGQQRITALYGIIRGMAPPFFDGKVESFTGLHFHIDGEVFEFYAPIKMKDDPLWIDVTKLMKSGIGEFINEPALQENLNTNINRLNAIYNIREIDLQYYDVTGEDMTIDVVVDIFNIVNSGGTKLSKGDLALAKVCVDWPTAREEMKLRLAKWRGAGFYFKLEWLLRNVNTIVTGEALFSALKDVDRANIEEGLKRAEKCIDTLLNMASARLGLDHDRVLGSKGAFPLMARYLENRGGHLSDHRERDMLLYWYVQTLLWGRYAGSTESTLNRDLHLIENGSDSLDLLINELRKNRGDLRLNPNDFTGWSLASRFYPLLYMLTRVCHAKDWDTGAELSNYLLGNMNRLELHHIFPKAQLRKQGYSISEANAIANFTFLTKETNIRVSDKLPIDYIPVFNDKQPGVFESHWIPMERRLWQIENYREFLEERRNLLAKAANDFLSDLFLGSVPETPSTPSIFERDLVSIPGDVTSGEEEQLLKDCNDWVIQQGLPEGEYMFELTDQNSGEPLAHIDIAWPDGLQEGYSQPVALLIDEGRETEEAVNNAGYRYFTDVNEFKSYIEREILALEIL